MITLKAPEGNFDIQNGEVQRIVTKVFSSLKAREHYVDTFEVVAHHTLISSFRTLLEAMLQIDQAQSREDKLMLIKVISQMKRHQEQLDLASGQITLKDIKVAGERLGRKSQSAFETK